jgi:hypothetical protein
LSRRRAVVETGLHGDGQRHNTERRHDRHSREADPPEAAVECRFAIGARYEPRLTPQGLEAIDDSLEGPVGLGGDAGAGRGQELPGDPVTLTPVFGVGRPQLDQRPDGPGAAPIGRGVPAERRRFLGRQRGYCPTVDSPHEVLVLQTAELGDQDQVAVALAAIPIGALKARANRTPLVVEGQEGRPV